MNPAAAQLTAFIGPIDIRNVAPEGQDDIAANAIVRNPILDFGSNVLAERVGSSVVTASRTERQLTMITDVDSELSAVAFRYDLGEMSLQNMKIFDGRAILVGQISTESGDGDRTRVLAIDLASGSSVGSIDLPAGAFGLVHLQGDSIWVVLERAVAPKETSDWTEFDSEPMLYQIEVSSQGLVQRSSVSVAHGQWIASGENLVFGSMQRVGFGRPEVVAYSFGGKDVTQTPAFQLDLGYVKSMSISEDGSRLSVIRGAYGSANDFQTSIDILDVSNKSVRLRDSITIDEFVDVFHHDERTAVLYGQASGDLIVIDLGRDQSGSLEAKKIDLPPGFTLHAGAIELAQGRLLFGGAIYEDARRQFGFSLPDPGQYYVVVDPAQSMVLINFVREGMGDCTPLNLERTESEYVSQSLVKVQGSATDTLMK